MKEVRKFSSLCPEAAEEVMKGNLVCILKRKISEKKIFHLKKTIKKLKILKEVDSKWIYLWIER